VKGIVKVKMFNLPNFLRIDALTGDSSGLDVGYLFHTDQDARSFWLECCDKWVQHVKDRREALTHQTANNDATDKR
jgi:hypothetical protein